MTVADDIRARARGGERVGGPYAEGSTSPVSVYKDAAGAVYWTSGMSIDCDGQPGSACNINTDPYFQAQTAFNQSDGRPLKAEELPFVVVPLKSAAWNYRDSGISGGDLVVMAYKGKHVFGVVGDLGPTKRIGEGSYAAAEALGINPNPRSGGVASGVTYVVFPGVKVRPIESGAEAVRVGTAKLAEWLGRDDEEPEPPQGGDSVSAIDKMIAEAEKTLGWSDEDNTKRTPIHDWYNSKFGNPDPGKYAWDWCNGAVTYWAWKSGNEVAVVFGGGFAYTVGHADAFRAKGRWHSGTSGIQRGDIVFFDWNGTDNISAIDHVGIVTGVKADGKIQTIEGNISSSVVRRERTSFEIAGYGRPAYATTTGGGTVPKPKPTKATYRVERGDTLSGIAAKLDVPGGWRKLYDLNKALIGDDPGDITPGMILAVPGAVVPPDPEPEPEVPTVTSIYFEDIGPDGTAEANKVVQAALDKFRPPVTVDGDYGPKTTAAYRAWQESLGFTGNDADGLPGVTSATRLAAAYGFELKRKAPGTVTPTPTPTPTPQPSTESGYLTAAEPAHDYRRVGYGGRTVNRRTAAMLATAAKWAGVTIHLTQGSYNAGGVAASAGTHDGGGAVDISTNAWSSATRVRVVLALRKAGFAAWLRTPSQGFAYHIHAIAIGDREASRGAANQVQSYFNGRNGLANNGSDDAERRWPNWADKYNR